MKNVKCDEVRTPRQGAKVGTIGELNGEPVAIIKQGKKVDLLTISEFASALYKQPVTCTIAPVSKQS